MYPEVLGQGANSLVTVAEEKSTQKIYAAKVKFIKNCKKWICVKSEMEMEKSGLSAIKRIIISEGY